MITNIRPEFINRYPTAVQLYEKANVRLTEGDADDTLTAARKSLEFFSKEFSRLCGLPIVDSESGVPLSNENLINNLMAYGYLREQECSILHRLRKLGNIGSHDMGSLQDAREAIDLLDQAVLIFAEKDAILFGERNTAERTYGDSFLTNLLVKCPFLHHLFREFTLVPMVPALYMLGKLYDDSKSTPFLMLAMIVFLISMWLHGKLAVYASTLPIPEQGLFRLSAVAVNLLNTIALPIMVLFLFVLMGSYSSVFQKFILGGTAALSVVVNPVINNLLCTLLGKAN